MKDLLIGAADNYTWDQLRPWALSIKETGFEGDVVLLAYRISSEAIVECEKAGIVVLKATLDDFARPIDHGKMGLSTQAHQLRNFHMWQYLMGAAEPDEYRYVIVSDTRDIYFQRNPSLWLDLHFPFGKKIMLPSEGIMLDKEDWNANMIKQAFGPFVWEWIMKFRVACNSGSFVGERYAMQNMLLAMHLVEKHIGMSGIDQGTLNVLGATAFADQIEVCTMDRGWACQCGTVLDPTKSFLWDRLHEPRPHIGDIEVTNSKGDPFVIVHQWDRVPELKDRVNGWYECL